MCNVDTDVYCNVDTGIYYTGGYIIFIHKSVMSSGLKC